MGRSKHKGRRSSSAPADGDQATPTNEPEQDDMADAADDAPDQLDADQASEQSSEAAGSLQGGDGAPASEASSDEASTEPSAPADGDQAERPNRKLAAGWVPVRALVGCLYKARAYQPGEEFLVHPDDIAKREARGDVEPLR